MADLHAQINQCSVAKRIDDCYVEKRQSRDRLGVSQLGHHCERWLWYVHNKHAPKPLPGRILRLFKLGELIEDQTVRDLEQAGYRVWGRQQEVSFTDGELRLTGHIDGFVSGLDESKKNHLWECKSAKNTEFNKLVKLGSYEKWKPVYKAQVHLYMLGTCTNRALVTVYSKNDSELYTERIKLDREYAIGKLADAFNAIKQVDPPERSCPNAKWFEAKFCDYYNICWRV